LIKRLVSTLTQAHVCTREPPLPDYHPNKKAAKAGVGPPPTPPPAYFALSVNTAGVRYAVLGRLFGRSLLIMPQRLGPPVHMTKVAAKK
jgi:hypothetical protein